MSASENKYLTVRAGVILTPIIESVIIMLDPYFKTLLTQVSSGYRSPDDQLRIIKNYVYVHNLGKDFPNLRKSGLTDMEDYEGEKIYSWQLAWSKLLNIGIIINPPLGPVKILLDYSPSGKNRKGEMMGATQHTSGKCFDLSGGLDHDPTNEVAIIQKAIDDKLPGLLSYVIERKQSCCHVSCV